MVAVQWPWPTFWGLIEQAVRGEGTGGLALMQEATMKRFQDRHSSFAAQG